MKLVLDLQTLDTPTLFCPSTENLHQWIHGALTFVAPIRALPNFHESDMPVEVCLRLVGREESAELNRTYRDKAGPTNILSFPYEPPPISLPVYLLGDLVVCTALVEEEAQQQSKSYLAHWAHLILHGTLHLLGYDHLTDEEAASMESLEIQLLETWGFSNPYIFIESIATDSCV